MDRRRHASMEGEIRCGVDRTRHRASGSTQSHVITAMARSTVSRVGCLDRRREPRRRHAAATEDSCSVSKVPLASRVGRSYRASRWRQGDRHDYTIWWCGFFAAGGSEVEEGSRQCGCCGGSDTAHLLAGAGSQRRVDCRIKDSRKAACGEQWDTDPLANRRIA